MTFKTIYFSIIAFFFLSLLQGCYEDLGNYDYDTINRITIDLGNNGFLDQSLSDTLQIEPELEFSGESEDDLSFYWYCNNEQISTDKELVYPVSKLTGERPEIKFKVVNNRDNSTFIDGFYVEIISDFLTGWVVLTKDGDRSILSYIDDSDYSFYTDFYTLKTGQELGPDALRVQEHWPCSAVSVGDIMVIRNSTEGNIEIDGEELTPLYNTYNFFLGGNQPDDCNSVGEYYMWDYSYILDDNKNLYQRKHDNNTMFQSGVYSNVPMYLGEDVNFDSGWCGPWFSGLCLFCDQTNGKLYVGSDFGSVLAMSFVNVFPGMPGDYTFVDNIDKELIYVGNVKVGRYTSTFILVYKDETSTYYVQNILVSHSGTYCMTVHNSESSFGKGIINDNTEFCQLERKSDYMFLSGGTDNKTLYMYEHTTSNLSEYYSFDSPIKTITSDLSNYNNNVLMVGLENGDMVFLGITYQDLYVPDGRFLKKVELGQGAPVSSMYKCGYQYTQY